jgi:DNA-binding protein H-NS
MSETDTTDIPSQEFGGKTETLPVLGTMAELDIVNFMESALDRLSIESLQRIGDSVRTKRQEKQENSRLTARQKIEQELQNTGLTLRDLFPELLPTSSRKRTDNSALPPKYKGPNGETWTGRGRLPNWLAALEQADHKRDEFKIPEEGS